MEQVIQENAEQLAQAPNTLEALNEKIQTATKEIEELGTTNQAVEDYEILDEKFTAEELSLHDDVVSIFEFYEHPHPTKWFDQVNGLPSGLSKGELKGLNYTFQRSVINRGLRYALCEIELNEGLDLRDWRSMIVDKGEPEEWLDIIRPAIAYLCQREIPEDEKAAWEERIAGKELVRSEMKKKKIEEDAYESLTGRKVVRVEDDSDDQGNVVNDPDLEATDYAKVIPDDDGKDFFDPEPSEDEINKMTKQE